MVRPPARVLRYAFVLPAASILVALFPVRAAHADCDPGTLLATCIDADTFWPHAGPSRFLTIGGTETTAPRQLGFGLATTYLSRPLVLTASSPGPGGNVTYPIDNLIDTTFLFSLGLTDRLELSAALPTTLYRTGSGVSGFTSIQPASLPNTAVRDARFGFTYVLLPHPRTARPDGLGVAARFELSTPVGDESTFAGDRGFVGVPSVAADFVAGRLYLGAELGARLRQTTDLVGARVGSQLYAAVGAGVGLVRGPGSGETERLSVGVEAFALPTLVQQKQVSRDAATNQWVEDKLPDAGPLVPAEIMANVRTSPMTGGDFSLIAGGGTRLPLTEDAGVTTPRFRFSLTLAYAPLNRDRDGDGVPDRADKCPDQPEDKDGFEDDDGCPDPDNDKDGIPDAKDRCRDEAETVDGFQDEDGCPDLDDDNDGVPDEVDQCRMEPEDKDGFQDEDGCPDPDNDKDGIPDKDDRCPNAPEDVDGYQDQDGCPDPDNDLDGIPDEADQCPNAPEDKDGFQDSDGCPDPDNDEDGVPDAADKCPLQAETINGVDDADGCPEPGAADRVVWKGADIVVIDPTRFAVGQAALTPKLRAEVAMIAQRARGHAPIAKIIVETYADRPGDTPANEKLAVRRADSIKQALVEAGVRSDQIIAAAGSLDEKRAPGAPPFDVHVQRARP